jgi:hypothetical protein
MAFDVLARFTINAETEEAARRVLEDLLALRLDPTSTTFQPEPHAVLDCWAVEGREGWAE